MNTPETHTPRCDEYRSKCKWEDAEGWDDLARTLEAETYTLQQRVKELEDWKEEVRGAIDRSGMGILRTSQGPTGTRVAYRPEIEQAHLEHETKVIVENIDLTKQLAGERAHADRLAAALQEAKRFQEFMFCDGDGRECFPQGLDLSPESDAWKLLVSAELSSRDALAYHTARREGGSND